ncbi:hypothetical protein CMV_016734 [Castanea mollissima]|uniref:Uncharacterized protein n=1 Tax=Castanea mollissima TaxID=60419 RepID=A0A8J4QTK9_9ROSI|nr:hypothetical protein CMV_016734 [Castanea mollissima]
MRTRLRIYCHFDFFRNNDNLVGNSKLATIVYITPGISILNNGLVMISKIKMHSDFKWQYTEYKKGVLN